MSLELGQIAIVIIKALGHSRFHHGTETSGIIRDPDFFAEKRT
jgi:hypothetical protein